jgi:hypothetical protein
LKNVNTPESVPPRIKFDETCFLRKIPLKKAFFEEFGKLESNCFEQEVSNHLADFGISAFCSLLSALCCLQNGNVSPNGKPF